jgi:hypothetical protein
MSSDSSSSSDEEQRPETSEFQSGSLKRPSSKRSEPADPEDEPLSKRFGSAGRSGQKDEADIGMRTSGVGGSGPDLLPSTSAPIQTEPVPSTSSGARRVPFISLDRPTPGSSEPSDSAVKKGSYGGKRFTVS